MAPPLPDVEHDDGVRDTSRPANTNSGTEDVTQVPSGDTLTEHDLHVRCDSVGNYRLRCTRVPRVEALPLRLEIPAPSPVFVDQLRHTADFTTGNSASSVLWR